MDHIVALFDANMNSYISEGFAESQVLDLVDATVSWLSAHKQSSPYAIWNLYSFSTDVLHSCASYKIVNEKIAGELQSPETARRSLGETLRYCPQATSVTGLALLSAIAAVARIQSIISSLSESSGINMMYHGRILIITASSVQDSEVVNSALFSAKRFNVKIDIISLTTVPDVNIFLKQVAYLTASKFSNVPKPKTSASSVSYFTTHIFKASPAAEWRSLQLNDGASVGVYHREKRLDFMGECSVCHTNISHGITCAVCFTLQCDACFKGSCPTCSTTV